MCAVRVIVAEDSLLLQELIAENLHIHNEIQIVGKATNGTEALDLILELEPDVLICDLVMPKKDGFAVLEELPTLPISKPPKVIVLTALTETHFIRRAIDLGANYYMVKPLDFSILYRRVLEVAVGMRRWEADFSPVLAKESDARKWEKGVVDFLVEIGIPTRIRGFGYLREAILMVLGDPAQILGLTKVIYPNIARKFSTSIGTVERSMRYAISVAWERENSDSGLRTLFRGTRPSNGDFITFVADRTSKRQSG